MEEEQKQPTHQDNERSIISMRLHGRMARTIGALVAAGGLAWLSVPTATYADDTASPTVAVAQSDALGPFLTDVSGMTLYTYQRDQPDVSTCTGGCAVSWPPLMASGDPIAPPDLAGTLGTLIRPDGSVQLSLNHQPLYYYSRDAQPGDVTGQGVGGVWFVASPGMAPDAAAAAAPAAAPAQPAATAAPVAPAATAMPSTASQSSTGYNYNYGY
jgi:predicted lipoprotein with Yx(FWY)xxD motif